MRGLSGIEIGTLRRPASGKLPSIPLRPGVYLFFDRSGEVIYVGKAKALGGRVRHYFLPGGDGRLASPFLERRIWDVEWIVTDTEKEALLLEHSLIQERKPRYNVRLKDDKSFLSIRLDSKSSFPRLQLVRRPRRDGARYFGPYASAKAVRDTLRLLHTILPLRDCKDAEFRNRSRPCIKHQIGRCSAPCVGLISEEAYGALVTRAAEILGGGAAELTGRLQGEMRAAAAALEFEKAARLRDQIAALETTLERQKVSDPHGEDRDIVGLHREGRVVEVGVLFCRSGTLVSFAPYAFETDLPDAEVLSSFLGQYYGYGRAVPAEVLLPIPVEGARALEDWLAERRGRPVQVRTPERGEKARLVRLAAENARSALTARLGRSDRLTSVLLALQERFGLLVLPRRIECFDISNVGSEIAVGARVAFEDGEPVKSGYRRFRIRSVAGPDDFGMIREVVLRSARESLEQGGLPDLVMVDGGPGQLAAALEALASVGAKALDVIALAKARRHGAAGPLGGRRVLPERVHTASSTRPHVLPAGSAETRLLTRIRDEAHRFAISYARLSKRKRESTSILEEVPGIGPARARALLRRFGGLEELRQASREELRAEGGLSNEMVESLRTRLAAIGGETHPPARPG